MIEVNRTKSTLLSTAFFGVVLILFVCALAGAMGEDAQDMALLWAINLSVSLIVIACGSVLLIDWSRVGSSSESNDAPDEALRVVDPGDANTNDLQTTLESLQEDEALYELRYSQRRCSSEEVLRAKALRLQAEIKLIRHQRRPKSWAEACAEHHSCEP